jgi:hypothetical protein
LPTPAQDYFAHGVMGRVFGLLSPTQVHASFEHACVGESALIGLSLPLLSPPAVCTVPQRSPLSLALLAKCVPMLAHWCVCQRWLTGVCALCALVCSLIPVVCLSKATDSPMASTSFTIFPTAIPSSKHTNSHGQQLLGGFSPILPRLAPLVEAHRSSHGQQLVDGFSHG